MIKTSFVLNRYYEVLRQRIEALKEIDRLKEEPACKDMIIRRLQTQSFGSKSERRKNTPEGDWNLLGLPLDPTHRQQSRREKCTFCSPLMQKPAIYKQRYIRRG